MKRKACAEVGIKSFDIDLPAEVAEDDLVKQVHELNVNPDVHGGSVIYRNLLVFNIIFVYAIVVLGTLCLPFMIQNEVSNL